MALESVFGTPPPIVGAANNHTLKIHGEKQRTTSMEGSEPEKEEGEIEDGEIIDSQDEEGGTEEQEAGGRPTGSVGLDIMGMLQRDLENGVEGSVDGSKKKKKKKKKRKRPSQQDGENGPLDDDNDPAASLTSKQQKQKKRKRYIDHDRIQEEDKVQWVSHGKTFPRRSESMDQNSRLSQSPPPQAPPKQRSPSRSPPPPGLYDSPPESSDEYDGPPNHGAHFGRFSMNSANYEALGERDPSKPANALGLDFRSQRKGMNARRGGLDKRGKGRPKRRRKDQQRPICKFYLDGKCSKGLDCAYSHDSPLVKKQELCKFYLNGFCAKSETCIFMHKEFPCKFFHTGAKCYSADKCKFSHDQLTDEMKYVLQRYLEKEENHNSGDDSPPMPHRPSLLGSPPRHIKEMAASHDPLKKIPSLFDIEVKPPQNVMPPGNNQQQPQQPMRPNFYSEVMGSPGPGTRPPLLPFPTSSFDPDQNDYPFEEDNMGPGYGQMGPARGMGPHFGSPPHRMMPFGNQQQHQQGPEPFMMDIDERFPPMEEMMYPQDEDEEIPDMMGQQEHMGPNQNRQSFHPIPWRNLAIADVDMRQGPQSAANGEDFPDDHSRGEASNDREASHSSESDGEINKLSDGSSGRNILIPLHLPKKQRELFLRIQQQQRRAGSSQEDSDKGDAKKKEEEEPETKVEKVEEEESFKEDSIKGEDEEELAIKKAEKEGWYSSDDDDDEDEDKPLTAVLKKLQQEPIQKQAEALASPVFNIAQMLQSIAGIGSTPAEVKPPIAVKPDLSRDPRAHRLAELRDPRSARNNAGPDVRDPRVRTCRDPRLLSNPAIAELPRFSDPRFGPSHDPDPNHSNIPELNYPNSKEPRRPPLLRTPPGPPQPCVDANDPACNIHYPIPYRLHAIAVSQPNYSSVLQKTDPRLLQSDPRLKKRLAQDRRPSLDVAVNEGKSRRPSTERVPSESSKAPLPDANGKPGPCKSEPQIPTPADLEPDVMASVKSELIMMANIKSEQGNAANAKPDPLSSSRPTITRKVKGAPRARPVSNLSIFEQVLQITAMPPSPLMEVQEIQECDKILEPKMAENAFKNEVPDKIQDCKDTMLTVSSPDRPQPEQPSHSNGSFAALIELDDDSDSDGDDLVIIEAKEEPEMKEEPEIEEKPEVEEDPEVKEKPVVKEDPEVKEKLEIKEKPAVKEVPKVKKGPKAKDTVSNKSDDLIIVETKKAYPKKAPTSKKNAKRPAPSPSDDCIFTGVKLVVKKPKLATLRSKTSMEHSSPLDFEIALAGAKVEPSSTTSRSSKKTAKNPTNSPKAAPKTTKSSPKTPKPNPKAPKSNPKSPKSNPKPAKSSPKSPKNPTKAEKASSKTPKALKKSPKTPENSVHPPKVIEKPPEEAIFRPAIPKLVLKKVGKTVIKSTLITPPVERTKPPSPPSGHDLRSLSTEQDSGIADDNTCLKDIFMTIDPTASPFC